MIHKLLFLIFYALFYILHYSLGARTSLVSLEVFNMCLFDRLENKGENYLERIKASAIFPYKHWIYFLHCTSICSEAGEAQRVPGCGCSIPATSKQGSRISCCSSSGHSICFSGLHTHRLPLSPLKHGSQHLFLPLAEPHPAPKPHAQNNRGWPPVGDMGRNHSLFQAFYNIENRTRGSFSITGPLVHIILANYFIERKPHC